MVRELTCTIQPHRGDNDFLSPGNDQSMKELEHINAIHVCITLGSATRELVASTASLSLKSARKFGFVRFYP
ncbi:hypothetical protein PISMIDRAFT_680612 [Pisolithus microcarpus 441]|uniref:Uncharacterized protein n=1 Tax=Pisolithus microcarpus 441 TaxID=765257 RepID=A0A0C9Z7V8_9AGAM|nr:hypothetical protein PISMIDRAFT_680612 [Pisolithus microcarpus 441]